MSDALDALRPVERHRVMDLVSEAGLDVTDWANYAGGAERAASNPKYCYQWSFVQPERAVVLNLWYADMVETGDDIYVDFVLRNREDLKGPRRSRAEKLFEAIAEASANRVPMRVIVNAGTIAETEEGSWDSNKTRVENRLLDPIPWRVGSCDPVSGACVLHRGPAEGGTVDQFSVTIDGEGPERRQTTGTMFVRDASLRQEALDRARGRCEYCNSLGFVMPSGKIFLETHHVVPLSDGGRDDRENIVAICANDHREAHLGSRALEMRRALLAHLAGLRDRRQGRN